MLLWVSGEPSGILLPLVCCLLPLVLLGGVGVLVYLALVYGRKPNDPKL